MKYKVGDTIKRTYANFAEVTITKIEPDFTTIQEKDQLHFIRTEYLDTHFEPVDDMPEVIKTTTEHSNMDDPLRHNISGSMNQPSIMQQDAFDKDQ